MDSSDAAFGGTAVTLAVLLWQIIRWQRVDGARRIEQLEARLDRFEHHHAIDRELAVTHTRWDAHILTMNAQMRAELVHHGVLSAWDTQTYIVADPPPLMSDWSANGTPCTSK